MIDESDGGPIGGANVVLAGTLFGTVSDEAGRFSLGRVRAGSYTLRVSMTGFDPAERELVVPDDVSQELVVALAAARVDLNDEPRLFAAEVLHAARHVPTRGDPYLADVGTRYARVPGLRSDRFGVAYSHPTVRGLTAGRTETVDLMLSGSSMRLPGAGILDFAGIEPPAHPAMAVVDPVTNISAGGAMATVLARSPWQQGSSWPTDIVDAEVGYQSNVDVLSTRLSAQVPGERLRVLASGAYAGVARSDMAACRSIR